LQPELIADLEMAKTEILSIAFWASFVAVGVYVKKEILKAVRHSEGVFG